MTSSISDVANKKEIAAMMDKLKLDIVEARILTGTDDLEKAAIIVESWGCPEILITHSQGVLARVKGETYYEKFSNRNSSGRTGRGDTTFSAYLSWRLDHDVANLAQIRRRACFDQDGNARPLQGNAGGCREEIEGKTFRSLELEPSRLDADRLPRGAGHPQLLDEQHQHQSRFSKIALAPHVVRPHVPRGPGRGCAQRRSRPRRLAAPAWPRPQRHVRPDSQ